MKYLTTWCVNVVEAKVMDQKRLVATAGHKLLETALVIHTDVMVCDERSPIPITSNGDRNGPKRCLHDFLVPLNS